MKLLSKIAYILVILTIIISHTGCLKNFDVARLVEEPTQYEAPEIYDWEEKIHPPFNLKYQDVYIDVKPAFGEKLRIKGMEYAAQLILEAAENPNRIINIEPSKRGYKNRIDIYNVKEELLGSYEISSDFMLYARIDKNSELFLMPEYAYYTIENCLLQIGSSLVEPLKNWTKKPLGDERTEYDKAALELRLAHDLKTILVQKYGLSEAYFLNYNIYTIAEYASKRLLTLRVYALVGYAGYSIIKESIDEKTDKIIPAVLAPDYHVETAARMVYTFVESKYYRLTEYNEPAKYNKEYPSSLESRIRNIFPFENMKDIMSALDDTSKIHLDIHRQALDYLRISGQGDIEIDD